MLVLVHTGSGAQELPQIQLTDDEWAIAELRNELDPPAPASQEAQADDSDDQSGPLGRVPVTREDPIPERLSQGVSDFDALLQEQGVTFEAETRIDLLASFLSSQFVLLAGPSGTGKSTAARMLALFFADPGSRCIVEARRQLIGPEDLVGYLSPLSATPTYLRTPELRALQGVGTFSPQAGEWPASPVITAEEANLSPIEGYLSALVHGLSAPCVASVRWQLHDDVERCSDPPATLVFGPYPRLLGTINVDSTALAPSPKVTSRSCVLLLEPSEETEVSFSHLDTSEAPSGGSDFEGLGASLVGSPDRILEHLEAASKERIERSMTSLLSAVHVQVTPRQRVQVLLYGAWYQSLATAAGVSPDVAAAQAAGNAILHFVLPAIPPEEFAQTLQGLRGTASGALRRRIDRLAAFDASSTFGSASLGFWDRLST